jgi:hypothetical protein
VALIHQLAAEGKPQRTIAALTGLSRPVVQRVLRGEIASLAAHQPAVAPPERLNVQQSPE